MDSGKYRSKLRHRTMLVDESRRRAKCEEWNLSKDEAYSMVS